MNIILPTPAEMPARLFDLMVQRFQHELVSGFAHNDAALNSWFTEKLEGRNILRASFSFDYDMAVEGEHLPRVMDILLQTVRRAGWYAEVHNATLDVCEIDFAELNEPVEEVEEDEHEDPGFMLHLDNDGQVETESPNIPDADENEDDEVVVLVDAADRELEFEDEDDETETEEDEFETDETELEPVATETRLLVLAIDKFGEAVASGVAVGEWTDIVEMDATTVVLELMRDGKELEIEVAAKFDETSEFHDVVYHVTPPNKSTLHFASLSALMAYLKEAYGDANKP